MKSYKDICFCLCAFGGIGVRERTCCFSGHRKIPPEQYTQIAGRLRNEIERLIKNGYVFFGAGGALGFDTMAADTVLNL
jgi:hypothetical protein